MTIWRGIQSHTTDVDSTPGVSLYQANTRMRKQGELQRRPGFLSTAISPIGGPVYDIVDAYGLGNNFLTLLTQSGVQGFGGGGPGDRWPDPPVRPQDEPPEVLEQDPDCAVGGTGSGTLSVNDLHEFGFCTVSGNIDYTENCCYSVRHVFSVRAARTYTGADGDPGWLLEYTLNTEPSAGGSCGAAVSKIVFSSPGFNSPDANFSQVVEGFICSEETGNIIQWEFTGSALATVGDYNRYDWDVSVSTTITNVFCPVCSP